MKGKFALSALFLVPMIASADTVVLRDGRTYDGTFLSGNSRQIVLVDNSGVRRRVQVSDVQELRFGNNSYGTRNRTRDDGSVFSSNSNSNSTYNNNGNYNNVDEAGMLSRIREDIRTAMFNANLNSQQRRTLEDARVVLDQASNNFRNGYTVNYRDVRMALSNVQSLMNDGSFGSQDMDRLNSDINQLRNLRSDYGDSYRRSDSRY